MRSEPAAAATGTLRRRAGEGNRPKIELDYIERLLRRRLRLLRLLLGAAEIAQDLPRGLGVVDVGLHVQLLHDARDLGDALDLRLLRFGGDDLDQRVIDWMVAPPSMTTGPLVQSKVTNGSITAASAAYTPCDPSTAHCAGSTRRRSRCGRGAERHRN